MDTINPYVGRQISREYTRDRIRGAEAVRAARQAREAARERREAEVSGRGTTRPVGRHWWWVVARRASAV